MNKLIINRLLGGKNKYIIFAYVIILISIIFITLPYDAREFELVLYINYYQNVYNNLLLELFKILLLLGILIISFEHDASYLKSLTPTIGRDKLIYLKQLNYNLIIIVLYVIIISSYISILYLTNYFIIYDLNFIKNLLRVFIECLLIFQLILLFNRENKKLMGFIILICYIITNFIYETYNYLLLFYLLPFHSNYFSNNNNIFKYQLIYLILLVSINIVVNRNEDY